MVCALMEPMHEDYDLRQEQYNKQSLLSSERFLDGLLDMWTTHVVRRIHFDRDHSSILYTWSKATFGNLNFTVLVVWTVCNKKFIQFC